MPLAIPVLAFEPREFQQLLIGFLKGSFWWLVSDNFDVAFRQLPKELLALA
jgi:hypothetical protein